MKILITGAAGFIGSNLADKLLIEGYKVSGIDNFNNYYDPRIKEDNLNHAAKNKNFKLYREDILNYDDLKKIFKEEKPNKVIHLAARAGVRPSIKNPLLYAKVNVLGTINLLKLSIDFGIKQFIFGSSSSVYGNSKSMPFREDDPCDKIISAYGSSKRAAEFWVESFFRIYGLKSVILRFFTVYGPRGRPDMAPALFTNAVLDNRIIKQFGDGTSERDYTYIDDVIDGILKALAKSFNFEIINLGNNHPIALYDFIKTVEKVIVKKARVEYSPKQPGDVEKTWANIAVAKKLLDWQPKTSLSQGLSQYLQWLKNSLIKK